MEWQRSLQPSWQVVHLIPANGSAGLRETQWVGQMSEMWPTSWKLSLP